VRLVDGIRKLGFRKWYERELTRSHLRLVLVLLCASGRRILARFGRKRAAAAVAVLTVVVAATPRRRR
jgi:hypothetical protein